MAPPTIVENPNPSSNSVCDTVIAVHVALRRGGESWYLYRLEGRRTMTGAALLEKIREIYRSEVGRIYQFHGRELGIQRPVLAIGTLPHSFDLTKVRSYPYEIPMASWVRSRELTAGFYRPQLLRAWRPFATTVANYEQVLVGSPSTGAIVIDFEVNKSFVAILIGISLIVTTMVGIAVGLATKRTELGIGTSAGLFALVSVLEALVFRLFA